MSAELKTTARNAETTNCLRPSADLQTLNPAAAVAAIPDAVKNTAAAKATPMTPPHTQAELGN